jgi:hypothetical protein
MSVDTSRLEDAKPPTENVLALRNQLHMRWPDAATVPAQMVQRKVRQMTTGNRTMFQLPREPMGEILSKPAIAVVGHGSDPLPAPVGFLDLRPKPINHIRHFPSCAGFA